MKKVAHIILVFIIVFSLTSCSGGISSNEAKSHINSFFEKIESEDYEAAEEFLHPDRPVDLQEFFDALENEKNADFSNINVEKYTGHKSSWYDGSVDGSTYSLTMKIMVSDKIVHAEIEIVKNDNGYGIYNFDIDFD